MRIYLLLGFIAAYPIGIMAGTPNQDLAAVKQQALERIEKGHHLGTVIGVVDKAGMRFYGFGQMSLTNTTQPDENAIFEIGSITKVFTATLLADLEKAGKINIQGPVKEYLPVFGKVQTPNNISITLEHLLKHTSGLPREPDNVDTEDDHRYKKYTPQDLSDFLGGYSLDSSVNTFQYSNVGVLILELAIETEMKVSYESLVQQRILDVLGMSDTHFQVPASKRDRLVVGYRHRRETTEMDTGQYSSMGSLRSTATDMLRFLATQLGINASPLGEIMKQTRQVRFTDGENMMGLGWSILKSPGSGKTIHYHKGGADGFVSFAAINLEDQIGVVVLVNGRRYFSDLGFHLLDASYPLNKEIETAPPANPDGK